MFDVILFNAIPSHVFPSRPVGPHRLATELRAAGFSVFVLDHTSLFSHDELIKITNHLVGPSTLFLGFSSTFAVMPEEGEIDHLVYSGGEFRMAGISIDKWTWPFCLPLETVLEIKAAALKNNPKVKLVLGGSRTYNRVVHDLSFIDLIIDGYADRTIVEIAESLSKSSNGYKLRSTLTNGSYVLNHNMKQEGFDFASSITEFSDNSFLTEKDVTVLEVGRGCIFKCSFCSFPLNGKAKLDFLKDVNRIQGELQSNYDRFGLKHYIIGDDTFNDSTQKLEMMREAISRLTFKPTFSAYIRSEILHAHPEQLQILKDIGLTGASFGLETLNPEAGKAVKKSPKNILSTLTKCREVWGDQVLITGNFIFGLPKAPFSDFQETIDWALKHNNLLDFSVFNTLGITEGKIWPSDIDSSYEKFGYAALPQPKGFPSTNVYWKHELGYTFGDVWKFVKQNQERVEGVVKISGFDVQIAHAFGYDSGYLRSHLMKDILESDHWDSSVKDYFSTYKAKVLELVK